MIAVQPIPLLRDRKIYVFMPAASKAVKLRAASAFDWGVFAHKSTVEEDVKLLKGLTGLTDLKLQGLKNCLKAQGFSIDQGG